MAARAGLVMTLAMIVGLGGAVHAPGSQDQAVGEERSLTDLTLAELADMRVTSVSRRAARLAEAPASIFVITSDDVRRAGASTLADALRLAPNLQVARADTGQYAISARGFNNLIANKLLVLVDGRTIYTPLFSGVFWDQQDVVLEDVERIEVISGPGATLWGANAVNGVINVIPRAGRDTHGLMVSAAAGNREQGGSVRYGFGVGDRGHLRLQAKALHAEGTETAAGRPLHDERRWLQAVLRADWSGPRDEVLLRGEAYDAQAGDRGTTAGFELGRIESSGVNLLGRWKRALGERADLQLQAYVDHYERRDSILFQPRADLVDLDVQNRIALGRHRLLWGAGYRHASDDVDDGFLVGFRPTARFLSWHNVFVQDEVAIGGQVELAAGVKLERNDYTGWEHLPSARLSWKPSGAHMLWGAGSRAVRAPARLDRDVVTPSGTVVGGPRFQSEVATVFELGYRGQPLDVLSFSLTAFLHEWDRLRSGTAVPVVIENRIEGPVSGLEAWASWQVVPRWRLSAGGTALRKRLRLEAGSTDPVGVANPQLANDPGHQWLARSSLDLGTAHQLDVTVRHVAELPTPRVPAYTAVDLRHGWRVREELELSVLVRDVFDPRHPEFGAAASRSETERGLLVRATWSR